MPAKGGAAWARDLVSAALELPEDHGTIESIMHLLRTAVANLAKERDAEFARAFAEAARAEIEKRFTLHPSRP